MSFPDMVWLQISVPVDLVTHVVTLLKLVKIAKVTFVLFSSNSFW